MMTFNTAVGQATRHLIKSDKARTAQGETLEIIEPEPGMLEVQSWGWDHAAIVRPTSRRNMIGRKCVLQMRRNRDTLDDIELRYIFDIMRREDN